ncbi:hypothetical protein C0J52_10363 [Blattella germanica]|nr:hypothetical protein C0J52_10363 [Blattella germanica]
MPHSLPEVTLLKFLLGCKSLLDLQDYNNTYFFVCTWKSYQELIWPPQADLVPYNLLVPDENVFLCDMEIIKPQASQTAQIEPAA